MTDFYDFQQRKAIRICSGPGCTFGPDGVKHGPTCPEAKRDVCPKCGHGHKDPSGAGPGVFPCLEIVPAKEEPGRTICACRNPWHSELTQKR